MMVDPIRRQLLFDFEAKGAPHAVTVAMLPPARTAGNPDKELQKLFLQAVQAEEQGRTPTAREAGSRSSSPGAR